MWRTSPAFAAGLRPGDVIQSVNGEAVAEPRELDRILLTAPIGSVIRLGVIQDSQHQHQNFACPSSARRPSRRRPGVARAARDARVTGDETAPRTFEPDADADPRSPDDRARFDRLPPRRWSDADSSMNRREQVRFTPF